MYRTIDSFVINSIRFFLHGLIERASQVGAFFHGEDDLRHKYSWQVWDFSLSLWDKKWNNRFRVLNKDHTFCFRLWVWLGFKESAYPLALSWFKPLDTSPHASDNTSYPHAIQSCANSKTEQFWHHPWAFALGLVIICQILTNHHWESPDQYNFQTNRTVIRPFYYLIVIEVKLIKISPLLLYWVYFIYIRDLGIIWISNCWDVLYIKCGRYFSLERRW